MYRTLTLCIILLGLSACQSASVVKKTPPRKTSRSNALQQALAARGFYLTPRGNLRYRESRQCGGYELQSHRGAERYPENSIEAVVDALDNGFDVVEVDVRVTSDDVWVVHHDAYTGRATGTVDNRRRRIEYLRYAREWGYLRERDMATGELLDVVPPSFRQLAQVFAHYARSGQRLNIEIKSKATRAELELLDYLAYQIIGEGRYFYSSLNLKNLQRMRDINPDVWLFFIQGPDKRSLSVLKRSLTRGLESDSMYQMHRDVLESVTGAALRRYRNPRYDNHRGVEQLKKSLRHQFGLVMDIRQYVERARVMKQLTRQYGLPVATYTINEHAYHAEQLRRLSAPLRPDSVIIDDTIYGFCTDYQLPPVKPYVGTTPLTKKLAVLPQDLDLEQLSKIDLYFPQGLYPALGGKIKSFRHSQVILPRPSKRLDPNAPRKEKEEAVDVPEVDDAIEIELRDNK